MNNTILKKCLDMLTPAEEGTVSTTDIAYVRGMLETLIAMQPDESAKVSTPKTPAEKLAPGLFYNPGQAVLTPTGVSTDEGALLEAKARAGMGKVMEMAKNSLETA